MLPVLTPIHSLAGFITEVYLSMLLPTMQNAKRIALWVLYIDACLEGI